MKSDSSSIQAYKKAYGKYTVIYNRIAKELENKGIDPACLAVLSEVSRELGQQHLLCQLNEV